MAWNPAGELIATGHRDGLVRIWEALSGTEIRRIEGHGEQVLSVAFSPDGHESLRRDLVGLVDLSACYRLHDLEATHPADLRLTQARQELGDVQPRRLRDLGDVLLRFVRQEHAGERPSLGERLLQEHPASRMKLERRTIVLFHPLRFGSEHLACLPLENGDELVRSNVAFVLGSLPFVELVFSRFRG